MRKLLLSVAIFLCTSIQIFGQLSFGVKAGANLNTVRSEPPMSFFGGEPKVSVGYHFGLFAEIELLKKLAIVPELVYTQRGYKLDNFEDLRCRLNYIEIPVLLSYSPCKWLALQAGPNVAFKVSATWNSNNNYFEADDLFDKSVDYGAYVGFKIQPLSKVAFTVRYYRGFAKIMDMEFRSELNEPLGHQTQYNRNVEFSVTYKIK